MTGIAGVALAAGAGMRLRPLTALRPKALCPVGNRALLDHALDNLRPHVEVVAVNAHDHLDQIAAHIDDDVHLSVERPVALGTAGALGQLRGWLDGRDVLLVNADAYLTAPGAGGGDTAPRAGGGDTPPGAGGSEATTVERQVLAPLVANWDRRRCRLLVMPVTDAHDFVDGDGPVRYVGACLLPWHLIAQLEPTPSGLYEVLWHAEMEAGRLDLVRTDGTAIDCGTPRDYLEANLHASGGRSVIGERAVVDGAVERCVVWPSAYVAADEHLVDSIRAGTRDAPLTVVAAH